MSSASTLPARIAKRAAAEPDSLAIESCDTGQSVTWAGLDEAARRWATPCTAWVSARANPS